MDLKYNLGLLKGKMLEFKHFNENKVYFKGILRKVKQTKGIVRFTFEDNNILDIKEDVFKQVLIEYDNEVVSFIYDGNNYKLSGMIAFTMWDTYGFPVELTEEILSEKGLELDVNGFNCLKQIQKEKSSNTFKNSGAW